MADGWWLIAVGKQQRGRGWVNARRVVRAGSGGRCGVTSCMYASCCEPVGLSAGRLGSWKKRKSEQESGGDDGEHWSHAYMGACMQPGRPRGASKGELAAGVQKDLLPCVVGREGEDGMTDRSRLGYC